MKTLFPHPSRRHVLFRDFFDAALLSRFPGRRPQKGTASVTRVRRLPHRPGKRCGPR